MEFHRSADGNYHQPDDGHVILRAECPSCGEWGQAMFSLAEFREMERI